MDCKWFSDGFETCTNGDCPYCADFCPVTENQEVCRYSDLDGTETMLRRCLDTEKKDSREAIQALAEENRTLKKLYENEKSAIDTNQRLSQKICELENQLHDSYQGHLLDVVIPGLEKQLAAYKDTGLEPETISKIRDIVLDISGNLDRLRELAQADRDGRCVVLPCKVGDIVWCIYTGAKGNHPTVLANRFEYGMIPYWGISVFLNKKQAETVLKEREQK